MTTLFNLDFSIYGAGTLLQDIDTTWVRRTGVNFGLTDDKRLTTLIYRGAQYSYLIPGPVHWEVDVFADDTSTGGPAWYFGVGNSGNSAEAGAFIRFSFSTSQWQIVEGYTVIGSVSDNWWSPGARRKLIMDWNPTAGILVLTVVNGATIVGSSTATGVTSDGDCLYLAAMWNDVAYKTITLEAMLATDGVDESTSLPFKTFVSGAWVAGVLKARQSGAWVAGVLKRFNGTDWE